MGFLDIKKELINYAYDPNLVQIDLYKHMEKLMEGNDIPDPTNPFMFLMESNATIGSVLLEEMKTNLRKLYPVLANSKGDLYHHIYGREIENIFAYPSMGSFIVSLPVNHITTYGENKDKYYELVIPAFTKIIVKSYYTFLFLNDVVIRYYPATKKPMAMLMPSDLSVGFIGNEIIDSFVVTDNNNLEWLMLTVTLKQVDGIYIKEPIIPSQGYRKDIDLKDQFYTIYSRATSASLGEVSLTPVFSDFVYDVKKPILKSKLVDDQTLNVSMYDLYLENSDFNYIELLAFTTKGKIMTSFNNLNRNEFSIDFSLVKDIKKSVGNIVKATMIAYSNSYISGGRNILTLQELKDIIVNNTTGDNKLPITNYDLKERANRLGYELLENLDSVLKREYTVSKELSFSKEDFIYSNADIFLDTLSIEHTNLINLPDKVITKEGSLVLEPFLFLRKNQFKFELAPQSIVNRIKASPLSDINSVINNDKYFYTIYKYVVDYEKSVDYRIYNVNTPVVNYIKSVYYNKDLGLNILYKDKKVKRIGNTYNIILDVNLDTVSAELINEEEIKAFIKFKPSESSFEVIIDGVFDLNTNSITFSFDTDPYIDASDKTQLNIVTSVMDSVKINGGVDGKVYIYTVSQNLQANNNSKYVDEVMEFDTSITSIMSVFDLKAKFYTKIEYLFSNYKVVPSLRHYKQYQNDVYLTYKEDIYEKDKDNNYVYVEDEVEGEKVRRLKIKHKKGSNVLNAEGKAIIAHKKGDVILDKDGNPLVDFKKGFDHKIDVLAFELEFLLTKDEDYQNYIVNKYLELNSYLLGELKQINAELLENTKVVYRPKNKLSDVRIYKNNTIYNTPSNISPTLTLYIVENITDNAEYTELIRKINIFLQKAINKFNNKTDIGKYIMDNLNYDNIQFIKIENMDDIGDINIYKFLPGSNKFTLDKKFALNKNSKYVPENNINIKIVKI